MTPKYDEPATWVQVFFDTAFAMAKKSKDPSTKAGAVLVGRGNIVLATGYNGPPANINDDVVPWDLRPQKYAYIIHAEENALLTALDSHGRHEVTGSTIYCTHVPCAGCMLRLIRSNVKVIAVPQGTKDYPLTKYEPVSFRQIMAAQKLYQSDILLRYVPYETGSKVSCVRQENSEPGDATT